MENLILDLGVELIILLQRAGAWLLAPMGIFSFLGHPVFYFLLLSTLYWSINARAGLRVGLIVMLSGAINYFFKVSLHSPRPYWYDSRVQALSIEASFGVPSGHAQNAVVLWGILAASSPWRWGWAGASLMIFLIGLSRMYLGVHFPHDVLIGWLLGAVTLGVFVAVEANGAERIKQLAPGKQALLGFAASLVMIAAGFALRMGLGSWTLPEVWIQTAAQAAPDANPIDPLNLSELISGSGGFFGLLAGAIWLAARGGFSTQGSLKKRMLRLPVGVAGAALLLTAPAVLLERAGLPLAPILQYLHFALIGFWIAGFAPAVFIRLGLAEPENRFLDRKPSQDGAYRPQS